MAARLLELWFRILLGAWISLVSVICCQVDASGPADHPIRGVLPNVVNVIVKPRKR